MFSKLSANQESSQTLFGQPFQFLEQKLIRIQSQHFKT
jgi:hypothetical protein